MIETRFETGWMVFDQARFELRLETGRVNFDFEQKFRLLVAVCTRSMIKGRIWKLLLLLLLGC